jgi:hypothetical protein
MCIPTATSTLVIQRQRMGNFQFWYFPVQWYFAVRFNGRFVYTKLSVGLPYVVLDGLIFYAEDAETAENAENNECFCCLPQKTDRARYFSD